MFETQKLSRKLFQAKSVDRCQFQAKTVDRPVNRAFGQGACTFVHVVSRLTDQQLTLAVDQSVDRLRDPNSQLGSVDRPLIFSFELKGRQGPFLDELPVDR